MIYIRRKNCVCSLIDILFNLLIYYLFKNFPLFIVCLSRKSLYASYKKKNIKLKFYFLIWYGIQAQELIILTYCVYTKKITEMKYWKRCLQKNPHREAHNGIQKELTEICTEKKPLSLRLLKIVLTHHVRNFRNHIVCETNDMISLQ